jgi:hypothetical protein
MQEVPMRLVPKQLQRSGMTGNVPYYGGRFTPAQAHAAAHPAAPPPAASNVVMTPNLMPMPAVNPTPMGTPGAVGAPGAPPARSAADDLAALQRLADAGLLTPDEVAAVRARIRP